LKTGITKYKLLQLQQSKQEAYKTDHIPLIIQLLTTISTLS